MREPMGFRWSWGGGVKPSRLQDFSTMLAGYCSEENYEKWVAQPEENPEQSPGMKL